MSYHNHEDYVHIDQYGEVQDRLVEALRELKGANEDADFFERENDTLKMQIAYLEAKCKTLEAAMDRMNLVIA
jgi:glutamine synthetase type III